MTRPQYQNLFRGERCDAHGDSVLRHQGAPAPPEPLRVKQSADITGGRESACCGAGNAHGHRPPRIAGASCGIRTFKHKEHQTAHGHIPAKRTQTEQQGRRACRGAGNAHGHRRPVSQVRVVRLGQQLDDARALLRHTQQHKPKVENSGAADVVADIRYGKVEQALDRRVVVSAAVRHPDGVHAAEAQDGVLQRRHGVRFTLGLLSVLQVCGLLSVLWVYGLRCKVYSCRCTV